MKSYIPVLSIAGSDCSGGAGIQADLKTFAALGCYGMSVITATTAQNTQGVFAIHSIPASHIGEQLDAILSDILPKAIKIGMLDRPEVVSCIADKLKSHPNIPIVFDPVMVATSGDRLIHEETIEVFKKELFPLVSLLTPNLQEAKILTGMDATDLNAMKVSGQELIKQGLKALLIKGGHLKGNLLYDFLLDSSGREQTLSHTKITTHNVHGTGCTLSSAIAAQIAIGLDLFEAVETASAYIQHAIAAGSDVKTGQGNGPLNHFWNPQKQHII